LSYAPVERGKVRAGAPRRKGFRDH